MHAPSFSTSLSISFSFSYSFEFANFHSVLAGCLLAPLSQCQENDFNKQTNDRNRREKAAAAAAAVEFMTGRRSQQE